MGFRYSKSILPQHLEIVEGSAAKVFCVTAPADAGREMKACQCEQGGAGVELLVS